MPVRILCVSRESIALKAIWVFFELHHPETSLLTTRIFCLVAAFSFPVFVFPEDKEVREQPKDSHHC
jgi:hypothetical protein